MVSNLKFCLLITVFCQFCFVSQTIDLLQLRFSKSSKMGPIIDISAPILTLSVQIWLYVYPTGIWAKWLAVYLLCKNLIPSLVQFDQFIYYSACCGVSACLHHCITRQWKKGWDLINHRQSNCKLLNKSNILNKNMQ